MDAVAAAGRLARVDTGAVATLVVRLRVMSEHLRAAAEGLASPADSLTLRGWSGGGYDAFLRAAGAPRARLVRLRDALEVAASALSSLAAALPAVQGAAAAANRVLSVAGPTDPGPALASELAGVLATFQEADSRAAMLLGEALMLDVTRVSALPASVSPLTRAAALAEAASAVPRVPSSAPAVAVWWAGLTAASRASITAGWTGWAGGIDGVPADVPDAINRVRLASAVRGAEQAYAPAPGYETYAHESARTRLLRLKALAAAVPPPGTQPLLLDASGVAEAVVATANVDTSRSVAIVVPGMTSDLGDAPALIKQTRRLAAAAGRGAQPPSCGSATTRRMSTRPPVTPAPGREHSPSGASFRRCGLRPQSRSASPWWATTTDHWWRASPPSAGWAWTTWSCWPALG